jgi:hypothetical protein
MIYHESWRPIKPPELSSFNVTLKIIFMLTHDFTMNYSPCNITQLQGTLYLSNNEEQEAHKAPSPHHDSLIRDTNVLNEMSGECEPVEPSRLLASMPSIKTPVAYQATGQSASLQEWGHKPQPMSHHHSTTPDDSPR